MGETVERNLKDYRGYKVVKVTDNKGLSTEKTSYMLNDEDDDNINVFTTLKGLKHYVDTVMK